MITYTTKFPINSSLTREIFIRTVIKWNQGSAYDKIDGVEWDGVSNELEWKSDNISLEFQEVEESKIIASRLKKEDEHGVWTTDFILNLKESYMAVSVALVTTEFTTDFSPSYYPPYFVKLIVYGEYTGADAGIVVTQKPHDIKDCEVEINKILNRQIKPMLPVVYISRVEGSDLDIEELAFRLQGAAHVVIESEGYDRNRLDLPEDIEDVAGKILILYPSKNKKSGIINYSGETCNSDWAKNRIINDVYSYLNKRIRSSIDTWEGIINEQLHMKNVELIKGKKKIEEENDSLYEEFGDQLTRMEETNLHLNNEIQRLTAEVQGLRMKMADKDQFPIIVTGEEKEFYDGEIKEIVLEILEEYEKTCHEGSRREHVIKDILENNDYLHIQEKRRETLKRALKGYRTLNGSLKSDLEALGIEITSDGKHYKWSYFGDNRYVTTVSKTSSDGRAGMNIASTMDKLML